MSKSSFLGRSSALALASVLSASLSVAYADDATPAATVLATASAEQGTQLTQNTVVAASSITTNSNSGTTDIETVVVTGTHTGGQTVDSSLVPISVASPDDLEDSGKLNLRDALAEVLPTYSVQAGGYLGQQGAGVRGARLDGLDAKDVLVLVDGERRHTTSLDVGGQAPVDLDLIPSNAIDHIEVLGDGAAALYGSDAIAGVINIILKKTDNGGDASAYYGQYGQSVGDLKGMFGRTETGQFHQGWTIGNDGFFNVSANVQLQNGTNDYPCYGPATLTNKASLLYPTLPSGALDPRETSESRCRQWLGLPATSTYSFAYNTEIPISSNVTFYSNATYANRYSSGPGYFRTASNQSIAPSTTPSPQDPLLANGNLLYPDGYLPTFDDHENDFQAVLGLKGELGGWSWDASTSYGGDHASIFTKNSVDVSAGPAYWGQSGFYDGALINGQLLNSLTATKQFGDDILGGPLTISTGLEHRYETYMQSPGELLSYETGPYVWPAGTANVGTHPNLGAEGQAGFSPSQAGIWSRNNLAAYIELKQQLTDNWTVDVAGRYEYFTDFGSAPSGQVSTRYELSDQLALRATFGNGFSAPTLQQEHYTTQAGSYSVDSNSLSPTYGQYIQQFSVQTNAYNAVGQAIGLQALKPEDSINGSVGFVAKPFDRTTLTFDGYLIDITNRVVTDTAAATVGTPLYNILVAQNISNVNSVSFNANGAHTLTDGFNVRLEHTDDLDDLGTLRWTLASNENITSVVSYGALPPIIGAASAGTLRVLRGTLESWYPKNITSLAGAWEYSNFTFWVKETHWDSTQYLGTTSALDQYQVPAFTTDTNLSYAFPDGIKISVGGTDVFDTRPTRLSPSAQALQFISATAVSPYNSYAPFGQDGGFYYVRLDFGW